MINISPSNILRKFILLERYQQNMLAVLAPVSIYGLTLPMLRLLPSKAQGCKEFLKPSKPWHVGIHRTALAEYSQMSTHVQGFKSFLKAFLHHFVLAKLATSSIRFKYYLSSVYNFFIDIFEYFISMFKYFVRYLFA